MSDPLLRTLNTHESEGTNWAVIQRWIKQACINASITIPMSDPLLRDLTTHDSEGTRWAVIQRWLALLANNITGGGGGGGWPPATNVYQKGSVNLVAGTQSYAVVFSPALTGVPSVVDIQVYMNDADGESLVATPQKDTVTAAGFTFWLSGVPVDAGGVAKWTAQI